jgi:hypothetical protein
MTLKGKRVRAVEGLKTSIEHYSGEGTIIEDLLDTVTVQFDNRFVGGHNGYTGTGRNGHCWNFLKQNVGKTILIIEDDKNSISLEEFLKNKNGY